MIMNVREGEFKQWERNIFFACVCKKNKIGIVE